MVREGDSPHPVVGTMKRLHIAPETGFHVLASSSRSQAATMVLDAGQSTGGPDNRHASSDQWLYVLSGAGSATVDDHEVSLEAGTLLLIEAGQTHEIRNETDEPLRTLNVYAPPAY
jgi:mannose-6-phosphate isomerase-like protein (cupin superfamily)